jgi:hypothetical protein
MTTRLLEYLRFLPEYIGLFGYSLESVDALHVLALPQLVAK